MKTFLRRMFCVSSLVLLFAGFSPTRAADTNPPPRLTVELRDGSRVVGTCADKNFKLHSALLGEIKLDVSAIRSVDCVSSNAAKLTAANGDMIVVSFEDSTLTVKTSFGKVELAVNSVRKLSVSAGTNRSGLVSLWSGEGNFVDAVGGNNGTVVGHVNFATGKIGQCFSFEDGTSRISLGDPDNLKFTESFTIALWLYATDLPNGPLGEIFMRSDNRTYRDPYYLAMLPDGGIRFHLEEDVLTTPHGVDLETAAIPLGQWKHVAGVFDATTGTMQIYIDGVLSTKINTAVRPFRDLNSNANPGVTIGNAIDYVQGFKGMIDEVSVFNRALSAEEIQGIYAEQK